MKAIVILCAIFVAVHGASMSNGRIIGGQTAAPGQFKYIASLRKINPESHFGGASVISAHMLLTAAHCCIYKEKDIVAVVGTNRQDDKSAKRLRVERYIVHEKYNKTTIVNDIALVVLAEKIVFNKLVQPVPLTSRVVADYERLTTAGWGNTRYPGNNVNNLQWMYTYQYPYEKCEGESKWGLEGRICTLREAGIGACSGDSGGPLVDDAQELVGITSTVIRCALGRPDFFTDVYYFKNWILAHADI